MKEEKLQLEKIRHSAEHVLTQAMHRIYGSEKVIMAMGPATADGFYFDFDSVEELKISEDDFKKIEKEMYKIINKDLPITRHQVSLSEARELFADNPYKQEWLDEIEAKGEEATVYWTGEASIEKLKSGESFVDLCKGPHVESTGQVKAIKLLSMAGAYWHGDEKNKMLSRIYGTAFASKEELQQHLENLKEAEKRNHRKIGKEMKLFAIIPEVGQGLPIWLPNGYTMRRVLEDYMLDLEKKNGYVHIITPHINKKELFEKSGHLGFYDESMYPAIKFDDEEYYLKPMNCPAGMMVYKLDPKSYRDLPYKLGEFGTVYRYEKSGELHGLQRVRGFTQNDAHIFCTPDQLQDEMKQVMAMLNIFYKAVGFNDYKFRLSLSDPDKEKFKSCGSRADWEQAEAALRQMLIDEGVEFTEEIGEAAFYGPKIDVQAVNVFGKEDSISTIQVDFNLPERFDISYIDENGDKQRPFVIHRALIGSFERFFSFLIEHHAGKFPVWLAPLQVKVLPIADRHHQFAAQVVDQLKAIGVRVELDDAAESLNKKIKMAQKMRIPYLLVIGDQEIENNQIAVRNRDGEQEVMSVEEFAEKIKGEYSI